MHHHCSLCIYESVMARRELEFKINRPRLQHLFAHHQEPYQHEVYGQQSPLSIESKSDLLLQGHLKLYPDMATVI